MDPAPPGPAHRLRDLSARGRAVAALAILLMVVPVAGSVARALHVGWVPSGDDALIVLRAYDVFSREAPLVGQPSTAESYAPGVAARHPGPAEFYLLAVPIRVFGATLGTLLTAAAIAGGSVLVAAWVAFRRGGPAVGLGAAAILSLVMHSSGTAVLSDPISSNVGGYPLLAGSALAWALWCGDRRLWPLAVVVWSFTIQQHLAIFGAAGLVAAWGVAGAVVVTVRHRRRAGELAAAARWGAAAAVTGLVCWLPPLLDQLTGSGNLAKIVRFSGHEERGNLGIDAGLRAAARTIAAPPVLLSRELTDRGQGGWTLIADLDASEVLGAVVGLALLAASGAAAVLALRRRADAGDAAVARAALVATAGVVLVAGIVTTSQIPDSVESGRINFYRWVWPAAAAAWGAVAWTAAVELRRLRPALVDRLRRPVPVGGRRVALRALVAGAVVVAMAATATSTVARKGIGDTRRDEVLFAFDARAAEAALEVIPRDRPVRIITAGGAAYLSVGPALGVAFREAGLEVRVEPYQEEFWGHRAGPAQEGETVVVVQSGDGSVPDDVPGEVVATEQLPLEPGGRPEVWGDDTYAVRVEVPDP